MQNIYILEKWMMNQSILSFDSGEIEVFGFKQRSF